MNIEVDYREKDIITLFEKNEDKINIKVCNLLIGDFIIKNNIGEIVFIIERKSVKDLCASIIDGRWTEQKERLLESVFDPTKIIYIIEGKKENYQRISKKTINSSILNLTFKHNYNVISTESKQDTVDNIILLYTKIRDCKLEVSKTSQNMKLIKKSDKINNNIFINFLSIIPGISIKIATKIHEKYNTINELVLSYMKIDEKDKKKMLSELIISDNRRLGKITSEKIYYAICGNHELV